MSATAPSPASVDALTRLPNWPRRLSAEQAAAYLGVSVTRFLDDVDRGVWPPAQRDGARRLWDRRLIDAKVDERSGLSQPPADIEEYLDRLDGPRDGRARQGT